MITKIKPKQKTVIAGASFGALTVMGFQGSMAFCLCKCGKETLVNPHYLLNGMIKYCDSYNYDVWEHCS